MRRFAKARPKAPGVTARSNRVVKMRDIFCVDKKGFKEIGSLRAARPSPAKALTPAIYLLLVCHNNRSYKEFLEVEKKLIYSLNGTSIHSWWDRSSSEEILEHLEDIGL